MSYCAQHMKDENERELCGGKAKAREQLAALDPFAAQVVALHHALGSQPFDGERFVSLVNTLLTSG
jgi:hypothetical protein